MGRQTNNCSIFFFKEENNKPYALLLPLHRVMLKAPGGGCDAGESIDECRDREGKEETGLTPLDAEFVDRYPAKEDLDHLRHFYAATQWSGDVHEGAGEDDREGAPEWVELTPEIFKRVIGSQRRGLRSAIKKYGAKKFLTFYELEEKLKRGDDERLALRAMEQMFRDY